MTEEGLQIQDLLKIGKRNLKKIVITTSVCTLIAIIVAFSVSKKWQGKGIASALLFKLAQAARDNGISGLVAYTSPSNASMIKLFKKLSDPVKSSLDDGMIILKCNFEKTQ